MKQTPLRQMIVFTEMQISELKAIEHTNIHAPAILTLLNQQLNALQSLLPYERECFEETYNNGAMCDMHVRENKDGTNTQVHLSAYDYFTKTFKQ